MASKPTLEQMTDKQLTETLANIEAEIAQFKTRKTVTTTARAIPLLKRHERKEMDSELRNLDSELKVLQAQAEKIRTLLALRTPNIKL